MDPSSDSAPNPGVELTKYHAVKKYMMTIPKQQQTPKMTVITMIPVSDNAAPLFPLTFATFGGDEGLGVGAAVTGDSRISGVSPFTLTNIDTPSSVARECSKELKSVI